MGVIDITFSRNLPTCYCLSIYMYNPFCSSSVCNVTMCDDAKVTSNGCKVGTVILSLAWLVSSYCHIIDYVTSLACV